MPGKRLPRFAPAPSARPRTVRRRLGDTVLRAGRWLVAPPRHTGTFDARHGHIRAWIEGTDRRIFAWFDTMRQRLANDLSRDPQPDVPQPDVQQSGVRPRVREKPRRFLSRLSRDESGATLVFTALFLSVMLTISAMAVDMGYIYLQNRRLQGLADLAAIAAATDLDHAQLAAERTVRADNWPEPLHVVVTTGSYTPDATLAPAARFIPGGQPRNAVRVYLRSTSPLFFGAAILDRESVDIARSGVASTVQMASFSVGTRLASLEGGIANQLLSALVGGNVSLSVMDYDALADANVELFRYLDALKTDLDLEAVSFDDTLQAKVSTVKAVQTLANVVQAAGAPRAAAALRDITKSLTSTANLALGDLVHLGPYANQDRVSLGGGTTVKANALDLVKAALELANKDRQAKLNVSASIPGLASLDVYLAIGERPNTAPWFVVANTSEPVARTAQARLYVRVKIAPGAGLLSSGGVQLVELPIFIELASAEAKLSKISCPRKIADRTVEMLARPSLGHVSIASIDPAKLDDFKTALVEKPATLVSIPLLLSVTAQARVDIGGNVWKTLQFTQKDIDDRKVKSVSTTDIAENTVSSLLGNLTIEVKILGLGLNLGKGPLETALRSLLAGVAKPLDGVLNQITKTLGIQLGQADIQVHGLRCHAGALVL